MKPAIKVAALLILGAILACTLTLGAAEKASPATPDKATKKAAGYPIRGTLVTVNNMTKTFTLKGPQTNRVFYVNDNTKITRHGKSATLAEAMVGEDVGGYVEKQADGRPLAISVRFGPKAGAAPKASEPGKKEEPKKTK